MAIELNSRMKDEIERTAAGTGIVTVYGDKFTDEEMAGFDAMLLGFGKRGMLEDAAARGKNLRLIQTQSAGVDYIRFSSIPERIMVCSNAGAFAEPMAEHTFAMILSLAKNIKANESIMHSGVFNNRSRGMEIKGSILGVFGYGGTGREVAKIGRALGMRIYAVSRRRPEGEHIDFYGTPDELDRMLEKADAVVISVPLTKSTNGLFDRSKLEIMKKTAILINVARGAIVVEDDLYTHLKANPSFKAGIDTWWDEPPNGSKFTPKHDFLSMPNFIGSPHNSGVVEGMSRRSVLKAFENIVRYAGGKEPLNKVNRADYS